MWHLMRASGSMIGAAGRAGRRMGENLDRSWQMRPARGGVLGPGSRPPAPGSVGYLDYRGAASPREIPNIDPSHGFPLGRVVDPRNGRRGRALTLPADLLRQHALVIGPSQAGKTTNVIRPWAAHGAVCGYATCAADVKGNLTEQIVGDLHHRGAPSVPAAIWDYRHPRSISWAFISALTDERARSSAAEAILGKAKPNDPQPYFHQRDLRQLAAIFALAQTAGRVIDASVLLRLISDQDTLRQIVASAPDPTIAARLADALTCSPGEYPKVMSGIVNALDPLSLPEIRTVTARDDLRLDQALSSTCVLGVGSPIADGRMGEMTSGLMFAMLGQEIHKRHSGRSGSNWPVLLMLDEAARLADRVDLEQLLSTAASANISIVLAVQSLEQFTDPRVADSLLTNCQTVVCFGGVSPATAKKIMERLGDRPEIEISRSFGGAPGAGNGMSTRHTMTPVLGNRELTHMPFGPRCAVVHNPQLCPRPIITDLDQGTPA